MMLIVHETNNGCSIQVGERQQNQTTSVKETGSDSLPLRSELGEQR